MHCFAAIVEATVRSVPEDDVASAVSALFQGKGYQGQLHLGLPMCLA